MRITSAVVLILLTICIGADASREEIPVYFKELIQESRLRDQRLDPQVQYYSNERYLIRIKEGVIIQFADRSIDGYSAPVSRVKLVTPAEFKETENQVREVLQNVGLYVPSSFSLHSAIRHSSLIVATLANRSDGHLNVRSLYQVSITDDGKLQSYVDNSDSATIVGSTSSEVNCEDMRSKANEKAKKALKQTLGANDVHWVLSYFDCRTEYDFPNSMWLEETLQTPDFSKPIPVKLIHKVRFVLDPIIETQKDEESLPAINTLEVWFSAETGGLVGGEFGYESEMSKDTREDFRESSEK